MIAIEPDQNSCEEAAFNFTNSIFSERLKTESISLQNFISTDKFDLIICNPPYFENSTRSNDQDRNRARHTESLPVTELYQRVLSY
ncbi:MAG: hypothetical protein IPM77_16595 [Crocinitomicaceae bacterium]|nr:hypothetical protein [Crocinitomicaceae bacterium]